MSSVIGLCCVGRCVVTSDRRLFCVRRCVVTSDSGLCCVGHCVVTSELTCESL